SSSPLRGAPMRDRKLNVRRIARGFVLTGLLLLPSIAFGLRADATAAICDPPGPPPRFACQWSTDVCDWICPVCDPFGAPPRPSCHWDLNFCNWICPGYTGEDVTVKTLQPPARDAVVYLRLMSLCTATGA